MTVPALRFPVKTTVDEPARIAVVDSWRIDVPDQDWLVARIVEEASAGQGGTVFTINLDHLAKLRSDAAFHAAYRRATHVSADGMPVVLLARAEGVPLERVTGADLVEPLCRAATEAGLSVHFFGSRQEVLERAVAVLRRTVPDLRVAGLEAPPMGFDPCGEEARAAARRIAASGAGICFVALGAPRQELFADTAVGCTEGVVHLGVGAALDFLAGERSRAPRFLQRFGLEWVWRIAQEPRRLLPRYVRSGLWLLGYLARLALGIAHHTAVTVEAPKPRLRADLRPPIAASRELPH